MGKKTKTLTLKEKPPPSWTVNCSAPARNLRKSDIGAVIFGCKHGTIKECLFKQLFGLPAPHFAYVKNISPGLPLFLFNYSDRKLHGIFEAASLGQLDINPFGWTDGTEHTLYAAQVRVRIRMQCQPLPEDIFRPVIADNYYEHRLFWFELDRTQTSKLIELFLSSQVPDGAPRLQNRTGWNTLFNALPAPATRQAGDESEKLVAEADFGQSDQVNMTWGSSDASGLGGETDLNMKPIGQRSYASVLNNTSTSLPPKKWSALFEKPSASDTIKEDENLTTQASKSNFAHSDEFNMEWEPSCDEPWLDSDQQLMEACVDEWTAGKCEGLVYLKPNCPNSYDSTEVADPFLQITSFETLPTAETGKEGECCKNITSDSNLPNSDECNMEWGSSCVTPHFDGESQASGASIDDDKKEICVRAVTDEVNLEVIHKKDTAHPFPIAGVHLEERCTSVALMGTEMKSSDLQAVVAKLMQEIERLRGSQSQQMLKINSLEQELVLSKLEILQLKSHSNVSESKPISSSGHIDEVECESLNNSEPNIDDSILIVGGNDGSSWLSSLSSYSPSRDVVKSLNPMTFVRSYASAAKLNGELYIFGGVEGDEWYDTVESYNMSYNQWVCRPPLNRKKGSLAGASLYDKIFAVGGGNGVECFSEVEMFDLNIGKWIYTRSMQQKRFAPAVAEINGALYVVGGYDGRDYLKSLERFDPREHSWTRLASMSTKRGCHSLVALNEKLYALGGYDGARMVSTVEVFDTRIGSWMMGEPMRDSRGYSGAAVLGGKIYIIGGMNDSDEILDMIECYKEGYGWQVTNLKAIGKRCFFSALVL